MSSSISILIEGYANEVKRSSEVQSSENPSIASNTKSYMLATGSSCLIRSNGLIVLFDTMGPWEKQILIDGLQKLKVHPDDIDYLVCSHSHPDHIGNLNLFTKAKKHFVGMSVYSKDEYDLNCFEPNGSFVYKHKNSQSNDAHEFVQYEPYVIDSNLTVEPTQGHTMECVSLIVKNCDNYGTVSLVGDLFENERDIHDESIWLRAGTQNADYQRANRSRIYAKSDYILPGHGKLFKTDHNLRL